MAPSISAVLALGGYASAVELLRYTLTGAYELDDIKGRRQVDDRAIAQFAQANAELLDAAARRLVDSRDPETVNRLAAELSPRTRRLLEELSPDRALSRVRAPLFLVHGRDDPAVPFTESLRLHRAARTAGHQVSTTIVGAVGHVDPDQRATARDLVKLWGAFYAFRIASARAAKNSPSASALGGAFYAITSRRGSAASSHLCARGRAGLAEFDPTAARQPDRVGVSLHPGAEGAYHEKGLMK